MYSRISTAISLSLLTCAAMGQAVPLSTVSCPADGTAFDLAANQTIRLPSGNIGSKYYINTEGKTFTNPTATETERPTKLIQDATTIIIWALRKLTASGATLIAPQCLEVVQSKNRSYIKVEWKDENDKANSLKLIAGPEEHWGLSVAFAPSKLNQLKIDSNSGNIVPNDKSVPIYLSLDWKVGDVFTNYQGAGLYNNFSIKGLIAANSNPLATKGLGIGYQSKYASPFVARMVTKNDGASGNSWTTIYGISLDANQAITILDAMGISIK